MPSATHCASYIKNTYRDVLSPGDQHALSMEAVDWFRPNSGGRDIPIKDIARQADIDYEKWLDMGNDPRIQHECDSAQQAEKWIEEISEDNLARAIEMTPPGVEASGVHPAWEFTPYQRLSMLLFVTNPFSTTSKISVSTDALRDIAYHPLAAGPKRKLPIHAEFSLQKGEPPDLSIIDLPTGAGKTAWSLCALFLLMGPEMYPRLCRSYRRKMLGTVFQGNLLMLVARLSIVAVGGSTVFAHFVETLERLVPVMKAMLPAGYEIRVWTKMSKHYSVEVAANAPDNVLTFWIMTADNLVKVRREHPNIAILGCLIDEFTGEQQPTTKTRTDTSFVLKTLITQATPARLVKTSLKRNVLREFFGNQHLFEKATQFKSAIKRHNFAEAYCIAQQRCQLDLITLTIWRDPVRSDLCNLLPSVLKVRFVKAKRQTLASHLIRSHTDVAPIPMSSAIRAMVQTSDFRVDHTLNAQIEAVFAALQVFDMRDIVAKLLTLKDGRERAIPPACIQRLQDRFDEFVSDGCPICMNDADVEALRFSACCGFAMCSTCIPRCDRCPNCRTSMRFANPTECVPVETEAYPRALPAATDGYSLDETIAYISQMRVKQTTATALAVHAVLRAGFKRLVILVDRSVWTRDLDNPISPRDLERACGLEVFDADKFLRGKGTDFVGMKARFDRQDDAPRAFICYGNPEFMVGTDLYMTDCILTSGTVPEDLVTQAFGRAARPRPGRDPNKPLLMVTVHV